MPDGKLIKFSSAQEHIDWACSAIREFQVASDEFFADPELCCFAVETDSDTGEEVFKVKITKPVSSMMRRKATDAILYARNSLDQSLYAATAILEGAPKRSINFPWAQSPTDLRGLLKSRNVPASLWDAIKRHEPYPAGDTYPGGNDLIRTLAKIANNKHTIGMTFDGSTTGQTTISGPYEIQGARQINMVGRLEWDTVKNEIILARGEALHVNFQGGIQVGVQIAFCDARLSHPVNVGFALAEITGYAQAILDEFKAVCDVN